MIAPLDLYFKSATLEYDLNNVGIEVLDGEDDGHRSEPDDGSVSTVAHVHLSAPRMIRRAVISLTFIHRPTGLPRTSVLSSGLTAALLAAWFVILLRAPNHRVDVDSQSAVALLLLVPTAIGAFLVAPSPHSLTARVLFPSRIYLGLVSLCPLMAATALVLKWEGLQSLAVIGLSVLIAIAGGTVLWRQYVVLRRANQSADARMTGKAHGVTTTGGR